MTTDDRRHPLVHCQIGAIISSASLVEFILAWGRADEAGFLMTPTPLSRDRCFRHVPQTERLPVSDHRS